MSLFIGKVIGTAMQKTAKVEVNKMFLHPHVLKVGGRPVASWWSGVESSLLSGRS